MFAEIEIVENQAFSKIEPNFIRNRFDLTCEKNYFLFKCKFGKNETYFSAFQKGQTLLLGAYLVEFSQEEFNDLVACLFEKFKKIARIKVFSITCNSFENAFLCENTDYVTEVPESEEVFLASLTSQKRYSLKRHLKKAKKNFTTVDVKKYSGEEISDDLIKKYFKMKVETMGKRYFLSPAVYKKQYYINDAYELLFDGNTAAIVLNSVVKKNAYLENVTYNKNFSSYSPGIILLYEMFLDCIEQKFKYIYWGCDNGYKKDFANISHLTYTGYIYRSEFEMLKYNFFKILVKNFKKKLMGKFS